MFLNYLSDSINRDYNWILTEFEDSVQMSVYLVAILISDYQCISESGKSSAIASICSRPTSSLVELELALDISVKILDFFEEFTRIPYALPKIGIYCLK